MKKTYSLPYGDGELQFILPEETSAKIINPPDYPAHGDPIKLVKEVLDRPGNKIIWDEFKHSDQVAIAINDKTRPVPHEILLSPLLNKIKQRGINKKNIILLIASGTHKPMLQEEINKILPHAIINNYAIEIHDCDDPQNMVYLGETKRKTPVYINKHYMEADHRIVVGDIEPHHFMGYSGGAKSAAIGLAARITIDRNHSLLMDERSRIGNYFDNPMRQDVEEIGKMIKIDLALNAILNAQKQVAHVVAGDPISVMKEGIPLSKTICQLEIHDKYDLVIASAGGYPKDINLYQSQKALTHAAILVKEAGHILLAAECREGTGSDRFEEYMMSCSSPNEVLEKMGRSDFHVGPHKAYLFAKQLVKMQISLYSLLDKNIAKRLFLNPVENFQDFINSVIVKLPKDSKIAILPFATNTIARWD